MIWDYDQFWVTFKLWLFKEVYLIDPGPGQDHFHPEDEYNHQHNDDTVTDDNADDDMKDGELEDSGYGW